MTTAAARLDLRLSPVDKARISRAADLRGVPLSAFVRDAVLREAESVMAADMTITLSPEEARRWFDREFAELKKDPVNPVGKVLIIDKILDVARAGGEQRFADGQSWAAKFARCAALALGRDMVRVDVPAYSISY